MARGLALALACGLLSSVAPAFVMPPVAGGSALAGLRQRRRSGGPQAARMQAGGRRNEILRFQAADMELRRYIGEMGYATISDWELPEDRNPLDTSQPRQTVNETAAAVRLWEGRVVRGPLRNARYLLKEYMPAAADVGRQELRVYTDLVDTFPATADFEDAPAATLRGWFQTGLEVESREFQSKWKERYPLASVPRVGNLWLAFRWDYLKPMSGIGAASAVKKEPTFWDKLSMPVVTLGGRGGTGKAVAYLRNLVKECISALVFLHDRGIVHRSIGPSSIGLPFYIEEGPDAAGLDVKLRDFGFAARIARLDDETLQEARAAGASTPTQIMNFLATEDIYAMGYALAETIFGTLAHSGTSADAIALPAPRADQAKLKALMEDIYDGDISGAFRDYCTAEPTWEAVVDFLDMEDRAGWKLLEAMVLCRRQQRDARKPGSKKGPKPLSEMSDIEASQIQIPDSFMPSFESDVNKVPTARELLENGLIRGLPRPWYVQRNDEAAAPRPTLLL